MKRGYTSAPDHITSAPLGPLRRRRIQLLLLIAIDDNLLTSQLASLTRFLITVALVGVTVVQPAIEPQIIAEERKRRFVVVLLVTLEPRRRFKLPLAGKSVGRVLRDPVAGGRRKNQSFAFNEQRSCFGALPTHRFLVGTSWTR